MNVLFGGRKHGGSDKSFPRKLMDVSTVLVETFEHSIKGVNNGGVGADLPDGRQCQPGATLLLQLLPVFEERHLFSFGVTNEQWLAKSPLRFTVKPVWVKT